MTPEEVQIVAHTIYKYLKNPPHFENPGLPVGPSAAVTGKWAVTIHYLRGTGEQEFLLRQDGVQVSGEHHGEIYDTTISGTVNGNAIALTSVLPVIGYPLTCRFKGVAQDGRMSGTVAMGEYGEATWEAVRS